MQNSLIFKINITICVFFEYSTDNYNNNNNEDFKYRMFKRRAEWLVLKSAWRALFGGKDEWHDQAIETQHLREDEDQNHAHIESRLLGSAAHTGVTNNSNGKASRQTREANAQTRAQMHKAPVLLLNNFLKFIFQLNKIVFFFFHLLK